jgi:hypothetical protein
MNERDIGWKLCIIGLVLAVFFILGCIQQYVRWIGDLQRRAGTLESINKQ